MSIAAIIAEYNPFYSGHLYQIRELRKKLGDETQILALMSGDFVQRGEPAVMDKYLRTELALLGGVSAVAELPVWMATASAADFAEGAVRILNALGCVDYLCFGCEHDNLELLQKTAAIFLEEPEPYRSLLKEFLAGGQSFPAAREAAFLQHLKETGEGFYHEESDCGFLRLPNNILAISYLIALQKTCSIIQPLPLRRLGSYHSDSASLKAAGTDLCGSECITDQLYPGATAIRKALMQERKTSPDMRQFPEVLLTSAGAEKLLSAQAGKSFPVAAEDLFPALKYTLSLREREFSVFADVSEEMANRLEKGWLAQDSLEELIEYLHTANYTRSRACRALLHILLGIRQDEVQKWKENGWAFYIRILGFRKQDESVIRNLASSSRIPVLLRAKLPAETEDVMPPEALASYRCDIEAADRYELLRSMIPGFSVRVAREYSRGLIKI